MLNLAEEILLIALDDASGKLLPMPVRSLDIALAGGLLMELVFQEKLKLSLDGVEVLDRTPTGDTILDYALKHLPKGDDKQHSTQICLTEIAGPKNSLKNMLCDHLVERKILRKESEQSFFSLVTKFTYPMIDGTEEYAVREHVRKVILDGAYKPTKRDVIIVTLISTCKLTTDVFTEAELTAARPRIQTIKSMEDFAEILANAVSRVQESIAKIISLSGM